MRYIYSTNTKQVCYDMFSCVSVYMCVFVYVYINTGDFIRVAITQEL